MGSVPRQHARHLQFSQAMQGDFCSSLQFLQRTDALARHLGCLLRDLPAKIDISERSMYGYRAGNYPVTAKALRKLEDAEQACGIKHQGGDLVPHETRLKGSKTDESEDNLRDPNENPEPTANLLPVLLRIAEALEALVAQGNANRPRTSSEARGEKSA